MILALGEAGNYPAAIKTTAEYFPKKDRALATSLFDCGSVVGALAAPVTIPAIAEAWGWEMAFLAIGALGFIWMGAWMLIYKKPHMNPRVNESELQYIHQDGQDTKKGKRKSSLSDLSEIQANLGICLRQVSDRWRLVFLFILDSGLFKCRIRYKIIRSQRAISHISAIPDFTNIYYRRMVAILFCRQEKNESI